MMCQAIGATEAAPGELDRTSETNGPERAKRPAAREEGRRPPSACTSGTGSAFPLPNPVLAFREILVSRGFILLGRAFEQSFGSFPM